MIDDGCYAMVSMPAWSMKLCAFWSWTRVYYGVCGTTLRYEEPSL